MIESSNDIASVYLKLCGAHFLNRTKKIHIYNYFVFVKRPVHQLNVFTIS